MPYSVFAGNMIEWLTTSCGLISVGIQVASTSRQGGTFYLSSRYADLISRLAWLNQMQLAQRFTTLGGRCLRFN